MRVRVGDAVGELHGQLERAARVHRPRRDFLEHRLRPARIRTPGRPARPLRRCRTTSRRSGGTGLQRSWPRCSRRARLSASGATSGVTSFSATVRPTRVSRARYGLPEPAFADPLEQVVMRDRHPSPLLLRRLLGDLEHVGGRQDDRQAVRDPPSCPSSRTCRADRGQPIEREQRRQPFRSAETPACPSTRRRRRPRRRRTCAACR